MPSGLDGNSEQNFFRLYDRQASRPRWVMHPESHGALRKRTIEKLVTHFLLLHRSHVFGKLERSEKMVGRIAADSLRWRAKFLLAKLYGPRKDRRLVDAAGVKGQRHDGLPGAAAETLSKNYAR